jgi:hypothetical protein
MENKFDCHWAETALGPVAQSRVAHAHSVGSACVHSAHGPRLSGPASACADGDGAAWRASARRSGHCSPGARRSVGGGANGSARAPTAERLPAGHGGGGDSSPELLVDGEGEKNWIGGGVLR